MCVISSVELVFSMRCVCMCDIRYGTGIFLYDVCVTSSIELVYFSTMCVCATSSIKPVSFYKMCVSEIKYRTGIFL